MFALIGFVTTIVIVGIALQYRLLPRPKWRYIRGWIRKNRWWTTSIVAIVWLALTNSSTAVSFVALVFGSPIQGVAEALGATPEKPAKDSVAPQGQSVGGPLRWSDNKSAKLRNRFTTEPVVDGVCFFGCIPPASWAEGTFICYEETLEPCKAFLVDFGVSKALSSNSLNVHSKSSHGVRGNAFALSGLASPSRKHAMRINNSTGFGNEGMALTEFYVQVTSGTPQRIQLDRNEPSGTFQYLVEVGADGVSVVLPEQFKWFWIAPVHHQCYQSRLISRVVPAAGISWKDAITSVTAELTMEQEAKDQITPIIKAKGEEYRDDHEFQAILFTHGGEITTLANTVLFQAQEITGPMTLRLNVPKSATLSGVMKPAKIIVGIQL